MSLKEAVEGLTINAADLIKVTREVEKLHQLGDVLVRHIAGVLQATAELGLREAVVPIFDPDHSLENAGFVELVMHRLKVNGFGVVPSKIVERNGKRRGRLTITW